MIAHDIEKEEFETDMKEVEARMKALRAEFNQYLGGSLKTPPNFHEAQIRKIVKKYASTEGLKGVQRFQYFNLVAKFQTMMEFYGRRMKEKQLGIRHAFGFMSKEQEEKIKKITSEHKHLEVKDRGHIIANPAKQIASIKSMFEIYNQKAACSEKVAPALEFEKFQQMIRNKTDELMKQKDCKAIRYRITIERGQVRIKAKPIK